MSNLTILSPQLYFSYNQFMVFDSTVTMPACAWTEAHSSQGFARRESTVCFNSILEFGHASVRAIEGPYEASELYERVIAVPFTVTSSAVAVEGPEEFDVERTFSLQPGSYRLVAAQYVVDDDNEAIDLFFEAVDEPLRSSAILIADEMLAPSDPLVESAGIAGS